MADVKVYPPSPEFAARAHVQGMDGYRELYQKAAEQPEEFWGELAEKELFWFKKWTHVFEWHPPFAKWFVGGKTNVSYNCLDRHLQTHRKNKVAILWEGEPGDQRLISYQELHRLVCRFANVLKGRGLKAGDRAIIYMGMVPELPVALLACARLGITHSVVFGGFSAEALKARIQDLEAQVVITADGAWRRGKEVRLKDAVDEALADCPSVRDVIVYRRTGGTVQMHEGRDHWWHDLDDGVSEDCPAEQLDSEHPLYVLYTSGTTGKPKGIVHTTAGYLLQAHMTMKWVFDLQRRGHLLVHGGYRLGDRPQLHRLRPALGRRHHHDVRRRAGLSAARPLLAAHREVPGQHLLHVAHRHPRLRAAGRSVAQRARYVEPAAARLGGRADQSGGLGVVLQGDRQGALPDRGHLVADRNRRHHDRAHAGRGAAEAGLGHAAACRASWRTWWTCRASPWRPNREGFLIIRRPWPSMARTLWRDPERYRQQYWERIDGVYMTGDAARRDEDGYFWILGRVDDVMNVSGHRLSTMEVESALVRHPAVAEAAVVGKPHEITGQAVACFVTLKKGNWNHEELAEELRKWVAHEIGSFAKPEQIRFTDALPKTRSGKIMRRLLREIVTSNSVTGDVTTLEDLSVVTRLAAQHDED